MKSRGPYKGNAVEPAGVPEMSTVNEGRHRWEKLVGVPLKRAVSLGLRSAEKVDLLAV